ncbi:MAG: flagellar basal body-associated protein FliL [Campylobacterales bacterium]|nr:flagellar basal body-associated protein FliL [Campylobacterales bacterium]
MAEEKKDEKEEKEGGEKRGGNLVLIIIIVVLILLLVVGGVVTYLLLSSGDEAPKDGTATAHHPQADEHHEEAPKKKADKKANLLTVGPMYPLPQFIVNLLSDSGRRYLKLTMELELANPEMLPEMDSKKPVIRDIIIKILSSKTIEEISTAKGKDKLKDEILSQLNQILSDGELKNLFFTDFVIQ